MEQKCYLNGEIIPLSDAKVSVLDIGLLRGFGIYEALTTFNKKPFRFEDHMTRFRLSAGRLNISVPVTDERMREIFDTLIGSNVGPGKEAIIRIVLTGGESIEGVQYNPATPTLYVIVEELVPLPEAVFENGASLIVHDFLRQFPESKTTNYIQAVLLQEARKRAGALEILYTSGGEVLECATSNFFIVKDGVLITPKDNVLMGITRKVVLELARQAMMPVEERRVTVEEMHAADEAFLTSSFKDIVPIVQIGERTIGNGVPGPVSKHIVQLFADFARNY